MLPATAAPPEMDKKTQRPTRDRGVPQQYTLEDQDAQQVNKAQQTRQAQQQARKALITLDRLKTASSGASSGFLGAATASPQRSSLLSDEDSRGQVASSPPPPTAHKEQSEDIAELQAALEALVAMDNFVVETPASGHKRQLSDATSARVRPPRHGAQQVTFNNAHEDGDNESDVR